MEKTTSNRIIWIDWAKAILIYLMVVGHCHPASWQGTLIYAFHMPAFFMISGMLYRQNSIQKSIKSLLVPVVFFSAVNLIIYALPKIAKGTFSSQHLFERVMMPYWGPGSLPADEYIILFPGVWFVIALFLGRLLIGDIPCMSWVRRHWQPVFFSLTVLLTAEPWLIPDNPLHSYKFFLVLPSLPFLLLGYGMKDFFPFAWMRLWVVPFGLALFAVVAFAYGRSEILNCQYTPYYIIYLFNAVLGG